MKFSDEQLQAWVDGEANEDADAIAAWVEESEEAQARIEELEQSSAMLRELIDGALGRVEPLEALPAIHARIKAQEEGRLVNRLRGWWDELWAYNRMAVVGVAAAALLGVVVAPLVMWLAAGDPHTGMPYDGTGGLAENQRASDYKAAGISIESLEVGENRRATVYQGEGSATTLIWVEAGDSPVEDEVADDEYQR